MSIEVGLTVEDYRNILNWFELAFAKQSSQNKSDMETFKKVSVMCLVKMDEAKEEDED